jgi:hypothetical protein
MPLGQSGQRARRRPTVEAAPQPEPDLGVGVLFSDDFTEDIGWAPARVGVPDYLNVPSKWYYQQAGTMNHEIQVGYGRSNGAGYRVAMDWPKPSGITETGRLACRFAESTSVHLRMWMKLSEGFRFFQPGETNNLWKQFRFHQSPWVNGSLPPYGVNGEDNTGFVVRTLNGDGAGILGMDHTASWRSDNGNSANGAITLYRYKTESAISGHFGDQDSQGVVTNTKWAQIDVSILLGDDDADNGILKVWFDGELKSVEQYISFFGGANPITGTGLVTNKRSHDGNPPGFNMFSFFDNYSNLTKGWTQQHYVYVDSVKIFDGTPNDLPAS